MSKVAFCIHFCAQNRHFSGKAVLFSHVISFDSFCHPCVVRVCGRRTEVKLQLEESFQRLSLESKVRWYLVHRYEIFQYMKHPSIHKWQF